MKKSFLLIIFLFFSLCTSLFAKDYLRLSTNIESPVPPTWIPVANMQFNMNVIGKIQLSSGVFSLNENDIIGAFVGTECRGIASPVSALGGVLFLNINSNYQTGELVNFKVYRSSTNDIINISESFNFQNSSEIGTMASPFIFSLNSNCYLNATASSQNLPYYPSGSISITVTSNCAWTANSNQSWCSITSSGTGNGSLNVNYSQNTSGVVRTALITISVSGITPVTISLTQQAASNTPLWLPIQNQQYNMNVIGKIQISQNTYSLNINDKIGAFAGNECRGIASPDSTLNGMLFLTIGSNILTGETINFRVFRFETNEIIDLNTTLNFSDGAMYGTFANPHYFTLMKNKYINIKVLLEGLYQGNSVMNTAMNELGEPQWGNNIADKVTVEVRNSAYPYSLVKSTDAMLFFNGEIKEELNLNNTDSNYIVIKNRNHIETWSATPVSFAGDTIYYDFTTSANKAYGDNLKYISSGGMQNINQLTVNQNNIAELKNFSYNPQRFNILLIPFTELVYKVIIVDKITNKKYQIFINKSDYQK